MSVVRFGADAGRTRVVVEIDEAVDYHVFTLSERRDRLVVDLPQVRWEMEGAGERRRGAGAGRGLVSAYRYAHNSPRTSRMVFDLAAPAQVLAHFLLPPSAGAPRHRLVIDLVETDRATFERASHDAGAPAPMVVADAAPARRRSDRFVVVIDPGHGGRDPGAVAASGLREADVNLAVAEALARRLERSDRYTVVLTRDRDRSVQLEERVDIARNAGADLFVSLHADASESGEGVRGASVYTLDERAESRSRTDILSRQNWLIDVDLEGRESSVTSILVDLAQRDTQNQSATFAEILIPRLGQTGPLLRNTHRSAGFYVLLAPDVPAVLVEMGFLSNSSDALRLGEPAHRDRLARAIESAIDDYYDRRARRLASR